jgi:hypothetical protein
MDLGFGFEQYAGIPPWRADAERGRSRRQEL